MHASQQTGPTVVGDLIVADGHSVGSERIMGEILEIHGEAGHERYRVRWEDGHESIFHPTDGEASIHHHSPREASAGLLRLLADQKIDVELRRHQRTESAIEEARALHASADRVGKTLVVHTPEGMVRVVIAASERLSLTKLRSAIDCDELRLATESELGTAYPGFELGAVPPFGGPKGDRTVIDRRIAELDSVIVEAGSHSESVRLAPADMARLTAATIADVIAD